MRTMGVEAGVRGRMMRTTVSDKAASCPLDKADRQFPAERPNQLWEKRPQGSTCRSGGMAAEGRDFTDVAT